MDVFFIRHGESANNALADPELSDSLDVGNLRVEDPGLTERGHAQAEAVARFVAQSGHLRPAERDGAPFDELWVSPFLRTLLTAKPIAETLQLTPRIRVDVHEVGGVWVDGKMDCPGMNRQQIDETLPGCEIPDDVTDIGWWRGGQETAAAGRGRAIAVAASLKERARMLHEAGEPSPRVAIVSHGDFMSAMVKAMTDHLPSWGIYYEHANTAITRFRLERGMCRVTYVNRADHLEGGDLVSP